MAHQSKKLKSNPLNLNRNRESCKLEVIFVDIFLYAAVAGDVRFGRVVTNIH